MTKKMLAILLAFFYSIAYTIVGPMIKNQRINFHTSLILPFVLCFLLCLAGNLLLFTVVPRLKGILDSGRISQFLERIGNRKLMLFFWAFIFVSWIPAYLILYPGVLSYDIISQVGSALGEITNNHHPVLHTWLIRVFMKLGSSLFSGYEYGIGILSLLQMIVLSYALARLVMLLKKKNVPILLVMLTELCSAIWFMNACLSVTMIKDTLHAAFLVLFVCHFTEIATNPVEYSSRKVNLLFFPIISFFMCAFRNNGIHIYLFCFAVLFVLRITQIKKGKAYLPLIAVILLPVVMFQIYTGPVFDALDIEPGQVREALSIPIQQLQRVAVNKADELTTEQMERMDYYLDNLKWMNPYPGRAYDPFLSDPAKSSFYSDRYNEDPIAFWKFYLQIGKQFTKEYIVAFLSNTLGDWYPGYYEYSYVMYENYPPEMFSEPLERKSIVNLGILEKYYESVCLSDFWRKTPVLRLFFVPGFSLWLLLYALALSWRKRGYFTKVLPLFLPLIAQYGIMILSPMSSFRYSWPFYLLLPVCFIGIFSNTESNTGKESSVEER
ncbi:MAG: DUF6020 family protein [Acetatifactor sp.]